MPKYTRDFNKNIWIVKKNKNKTFFTFERNKFYILKIYFK